MKNLIPNIWLFCSLLKFICTVHEKNFVEHITCYIYKITHGLSFSLSFCGFFVILIFFFNDLLITIFKIHFLGLDKIFSCLTTKTRIFPHVIAVLYIRWYRGFTRTEIKSLDWIIISHQWIITNGTACNKMIVYCR